MMAMQPGTQNERQRAQAETLQRAQLAIQNDRPAEAERIAGEILRPIPAISKRPKSSAMRW